MVSGVAPRGLSELAGGCWGCVTGTRTPLLLLLRDVQRAVFCRVTHLNTGVALCAQWFLSDVVLPALGPNAQNLFRADLHIEVWGDQQVSGATCDLSPVRVLRAEVHC